VLAALGVIMCTAAPAAAHGRIFIGGVFGVPPPVVIYPYPAAYPYPYAVYGPPEVPPPGWVAGHWEWRHDAWGRPIQVWVPPHLR
jgi:hypothetical protein